MSCQGILNNYHKVYALGNSLQDWCTSQRLSPPRLLLNLLTNLSCHDWVYCPRGRLMVALPIHPGKTHCLHLICIARWNWNLGSPSGLGWKKSFPQSFSVICGITVHFCRMFIVPMTAAFSLLQEYHLHFALS